MEDHASIPAVFAQRESLDFVSFVNSELWQAPKSTRAAMPGSTPLAKSLRFAQQIERANELTDSLDQNL